MREARLWKPLGDERVQCRLCSHFCVMEHRAAGKCGVRVNEHGTLYTLVADRIAALNTDPVEKKPLFHFMPGTRTLSFATMGCNLACSWCQNYTLSQPTRGGRRPGGEKIDPEQLIMAAKDSGASSISYTYSEPTIFFELLQDTAKLAIQAGLKNIMVSNGYQSPECLEALRPLIHAANIDLKSFDEKTYRRHCGARLQPVLANLKRMKEFDWWLEVTTLVIPGVNDSPEELTQIARFIADELGHQTPWHVSRFHPDYTMMDREPTPVQNLEKAYDIGREAGLDHVYAGNVPGHVSEHTTCPSCNTQVIRRNGFTIKSNTLQDGKCAQCGAPIAGQWS